MVLRVGKKSTGLVWAALLAAHCGLAESSNLYLNNLESAQVLKVKSRGLTPEQASGLAESFGIDVDKGLTSSFGAFQYADESLFERIPVKKLGFGKSEEDGYPVVLESLDFEAINQLEALDSKQAMNNFAKSLKDSRLWPQGLFEVLPKPSHGHFHAQDINGKTISDVDIDTRVHLDLSFEGLQLLGPGANISVAFATDGKVSKLTHSSSQVDVGEKIGLLNKDEAVRSCLNEYQETLLESEVLDVVPRLVYYVPHLSVKAQAFIPHFECHVTAIIDDKKVELLRKVVPASDDARYVPSLELVAESSGESVTARVEVKGGLKPYQIEWSSSSTSIVSDDVEVKYQPRPREKGMIERVTARITDSNGVSVVKTVSLGSGFKVFKPSFDAEVGGVRDFGTENAVTNEFGSLEQGFINQMMSDGVNKRFSWTGTNAWEQDFKWNQDSNYVDNTDITFYVGHGYGGGFTFEDTAHDDSTLTYTDANGDWGDKDLEWLSLLSCQVLKDSWSGLNRYDRWKQEFDGLHILLGFHTNAYAWNSFSGAFAHNMVRNPFLWWNHPMKVKDAWFDAKDDEQPSGVVAVAMGVYRHDYVSNINDYFWGKGSVGPDIRGGDIAGYWSITSP